MKTRIFSGLVAATCTAALFLYGPMWALTGVALLCAGVAYLEYDRLFFPPKNSRQLRLVTLISVTIIAMAVSGTAAWLSFWFAISFLFVSHVISGDRRGDSPMEVRAISLELMGYWYIVSLFGFLVPLADRPEHGRLYLLLLFFVVFTNDTIAYFVGKRWGRRKLAANVSPKKTVEGSLGGVVGAVIGVAAWFYFFRVSIEGSRLVALFVAAPVIGALAQFGDLFESLLKRSQQQKDSGSFLPGHGGMLDRVDGLALTAPAFYFYIVYLVETL